MPLHIIPKLAFINLFKFTGVSQKIIDQAYTDNIKDISELIANIAAIGITDEITDFEKWRIISKLNIIDDVYSGYFGETDLSIVFESTYKNIGSSKVFMINRNNSLHVYYIYGILKKLSEEVKEDMLVIIPQASEIFNNSFIGNELLTILKENPKLNYCIGAGHIDDFIDKEPATVKIEVISNNDVVIRYPDKDPLRLLLRPTLTSSNLEIKKEETTI